MKAKVDPELCIGCQLCIQAAPTVFEMIEDKAVTIANPVPIDAEKSALEAVDACPVDAIIIE